MRNALLLASVLLVAACTKNDEAPAEGGAAATGAEQQGTGTSAAPAVADAALAAVDSVSLQPESPVAGESVQAVVQGDNRRILQFTWFVDGEELFGERGDRISGNYAKKGRRIKVRVTPVADGKEGASKESNEAVVANTAPRIDGIDVVSSEGATVVLKARASDADADPLVYKVVSGPAGMTIDGEGTIRWSAPQEFAGPVSFAVSVSDGDQEFVQESTIGAQ